MDDFDRRLEIELARLLDRVVLTPAPRAPSERPGGEALLQRQNADCDGRRVRVASRPRLGAVLLETPSFLSRGRIAVFRPEANANRFRRSARRLALPELPDSAFVEAIDQLVRLDADWVPSEPEHSLYLRPFMYASEVSLMVHPSDEVTFVLIASPSASYFPSGVKPVTVWLSEDFSRAAPGGTGDAKTGGNYAGSLLAQAQAAEHGCDQVVWLDAIEHRWVEEMGGMNLCFVFGRGQKARLVTPELTGTLLPGVTRDSLLTLARDLGYEAEEGRVSVEQWRAGCADGSLSEVFACGTAAVITPVGAVKSARASWLVGDGKPGAVSMQLREALVDIQRGAAPDVHRWMHAVPLA